MKIICDRDVLSENINAALKAVSSRTTLQILECVLLIAEDDNFRIIGNDLEIGIETSAINAEIFEAGSVAIDAKMLSDVIRRLPPGDVSVQTDANNMTIIKCQKAEYKIFGQPGDEFPFLPKIEKSERYEISANAFKNIVRQTVFSVAIDDSKPVLTGELMEIKNGALKLVALDGFRVALREAALGFESVEDEEDYEEKNKEEENVEENKEDGEKNEDNKISAIDISFKDVSAAVKCIIPSKALNELGKLISSEKDEPLGIYVTEKYVLFELTSCVVVSRLLEGEFINYENIFTNDYTTLVRADRTRLIDCVDRASLINRDKKSPTKFKIADDRIVITSMTEMGTSYDEADVEIDGIPLDISFNHRYVIEALKAIDEDFVEIQFTTPLSPCIIRSEENMSYKYLILPLRTMN